MAGSWFSRRGVGCIALHSPRRLAIELILVVPTLLAPRDAAAQESAPAFTFSVSCPGEIRAGPGAAFERDIEVILEGSANPGDVGAQGWAFVVVSAGVRIISITTKGTLPAEIAGCPDVSIREEDCPGVSTLGTCEGHTSAMSAVALSSTRPLALPPAGPVTVALIRIAGEAPQAIGEGASATLQFVDGCRGTGQAIYNAVTWQGRTLHPAIEACDFTIVAGEPLFRRGDVNGDTKLDIADPISLLGCKFLGARCPTCWDASDANDDGDADLSDAVAMLGYIFLAWLPPPFPASECGSDPTEDELPACERVCGP